MRFHHIVELECTIDDRLECAARKTFDDVFHGGAPACLVAHYLSDAVALDGWHLGYHLQHRYRGVILAQCAVDVDDTLICERRDQLGKVRTAHRIEGNACALAVGDAHHFGDHVLLLCCNDVRSTGIVCDLNRRQADAAGSCRNDNEVALFHFCVDDERAVGRYEHHPD